LRCQEGVGVNVCVGVKSWGREDSRGIFV